MFLEMYRYNNIWKIQAHTVLYIHIYVDHITLVQKILMV